MLEKAARHGDKVAQLELGKRYEEGSGVPRNEQKAISLYRRAARTDVRQTSVYSPAVGAERYGRVVQVAQPTIAPGLPEADARLTALRKRLGGK
ncbi:MAG: SEL1-like repeat protein [Candidatus Sphingomonas phytovorans]|nr:SEL1-like repeat protein [Sphingomonas sp.]WEK00989.1 MAG: SEL1-like repeat protein [Sphingomonas sp.]